LQLACRGDASRYTRESTQLPPQRASRHRFPREALPRSAGYGPTYASAPEALPGASDPEREAPRRFLEDRFQLRFPSLRATITEELFTGCCSKNQLRLESGTPPSKLASNDFWRSG
jgi:hypothetical protein